MIRKAFGILVAVFLIGGLVMQLKDNPKTTGRAAANVVNETTDAGQGLWSGIITFFDELDF